MSTRLIGSESLRLPFGDQRILDFYLDLLAKDENQSDWTSDALRLVGNSCADLGSCLDDCCQFTGH